MFGDGVDDDLGACVGGHAVLGVLLGDAERGSVGGNGGVGDGGGDIAWEDEGDVDAGVMQFGFEGVKVALDRVFTGGVGGAHGGGDVACDATDHADGALVALEHMGEDGAGEFDGRKEVHVHDFTRGGFGGVEGGGALGDAGVIEEHVEVSFPCDGVLDGLVAGVGLGEVDGQDEALGGSDVFCQGVERFFSTRAEDDVGAFFGEGFGACFADA